MARGDVFPSEKREFSDPATDVRVIQLTDQPCANTNAYYNQEQFIGGSERFVFTSTRSGTQQLYTVEVSSGKIVQLTDADEPSGGFTVDSQRGIVYFGRGGQILALDVESLREEVVAEPPEGCGGLGSPDLSSCGRYIILGCGPASRRESFAYRYGREALLILCDVREKRQEVVYHGPSPDNQATPDSHCFISRGDPSYLFFGSYSRLQPTGIKTAWFMRVDLERLRPIQDPMPLFDQQPFDYINHYYPAPDNHVQSFHYRHTAYDRDGVPISDDKMAMLLDVDLTRRTTSRWVFPGLAPVHFKCNNADDMWAGDRADPGFLWLEGRGAGGQAESESDEYWLHYWPEASPPSFPAHEWIGVFRKHHSSYLEVRPLVRHKTNWVGGAHPHPVFSPDDKWIAYCAGDKERSQLYLAEAVWPRWPK